MTRCRVCLAAALALTLSAAACSQDELLTPPVPTYAGGAMFQRYVSMGNSITMGIQSGGINDSTQKLAYPVLVAGALGGTPFYYPSLTNPGCPPPYTNIFANTRVGGGTGTTCLFRSSAIPPYISNVAVTGAEVLDLVANGPGPGTNSNALTQLALGGRTQVQAMMDAQPTFVSVWIGNNDILSAAFASDVTLITDLTTFQARYRQALDSIENVGAKGLLIAVGLGTLSQTVPPFWSKGSTYFAIKAGLVPGVSFPPNFTVTANCAPPRGDSVFVPFPFGLGLVNAAAGGTPTTLDCTEPQTIQPDEFVTIVNTQVAYNTFIQAEAAARGWAYLQLNATFDSLRAVAGQIAAFPNAPQPCSANPFGAAFSCDGFHPSTSAHRLIARKVVQAINAFYQSAIPAVP